MKTYQEIRKMLNTFDIIVCSHKSLFWKIVGHTAMLVKDKEKDTLSIWQSTTQYANVKGTSLAYFNEWLTQYPGKVFIRRVSMPNTLRVQAEVLLDQYITKHRDHPYPDLKSLSGLWYMKNIVMDLLPWQTNKPNPKNDARCCSDRVAHTLQYCGILNDRINPSEIDPDDFRDYMPFHKPIDRYVNPRVIIMPEVRIK